jgi:hypothetical protein
MDKKWLDDTAMQTAFGSGDAHRLGELPGSPVVYQGRYWRHDGHRWTPIEDPETIAFLEHAQRRLALADGAVDSAAEDKQS